MPFMDYVLDRMVAFASRLTLTFLGFVMCLVVYGLHEHDDAISSLWLVLDLRSGPLIVRWVRRVLRLSRYSVFRRMEMARKAPATGVG